MKIYTEEKLAEALKNNEDSLEIEGDLAKKVIKIRATGKVAWAIAIAAIGVAVAGIIAAVPTGGTAGVAGIGFASASTAILGATTTISAITIAVTAGGVGVLNSLRSYKEVSRTQNSIILQRKV